jgi:hypothetical protein
MKNESGYGAGKIAREWTAGWATAGPAAFHPRLTLRPAKTPASASA